MAFLRLDSRLLTLGSALLVALLALDVEAYAQRGGSRSTPSRSTPSRSVGGSRPTARPSTPSRSYSSPSRSSTPSYTGSSSSSRPSSVGSTSRPSYGGGSSSSGSSGSSVRYTPSTPSVTSRPDSTSSSSGSSSSRSLPTVGAGPSASRAGGTPVVSGGASSSYDGWRARNTTTTSTSPGSSSTSTPIRDSGNVIDFGIASPAPRRPAFPSPYGSSSRERSEVPSQRTRILGDQGSQTGAGARIDAVRPKVSFRSGNVTRSDVLERYRGTSSDAAAERTAADRTAAREDVPLLSRTRGATSSAVRPELDAGPSSTRGRADAPLDERADKRGDSRSDTRVDERKSETRPSSKETRPTRGDLGRSVRDLSSQDKTRARDVKDRSEAAGRVLESGLRVASATLLGATGVRGAGSIVATDRGVSKWKNQNYGLYYGLNCPSYFFRGFNYCGYGWLGYGWSWCWNYYWYDCGYYWWYPRTYSCYRPFYSYVVYQTIEREVPVYIQSDTVAADAGNVVYIEDGDVVAGGGGSEPRNLALEESLGRAADYYLILGDRAFREERFGDAVHYYAKAVEFGGEEGVLYLILSDALFATGDYHYAAYALRRALELDPALMESVIDKRSFYSDARAFDRQLATLELYLEDHFLDDDARLVLAANYLFGGRPAAAVDLLSSSFSEDVRESDAGRLLLESAQALQFGTPSDD